MNWLERRIRRQTELAQGIDADLVRDNRKRYKFAIGLLSFAVLLSFLTSKVHLAEPLRPFVGAIAGCSGVAGLVLLVWARQEEIVLNKPDPEDPPNIFK